MGGVMRSHRHEPVGRFLGQDHRPTSSRRRFLGLLGGCLLSSLLPGCLSRRAAPLVVASNVWPGFEPLFLAGREGWLPSRELSLLETESATESLRALTTGRADVAALTLGELLQARASGVPLTVILVFDVSAGADMVLVRPGIAGIADLAGKRIAVEESTLGAMMLYKTLETAGLPSGAVTVLSLPVHAHAEAWRTGLCDAVITYEPFASRLRELGARRIFDSRELPATIVDVLGARRSVLGRSADALRGLVAGHFRALHHLRTNPQDAAYRMAGHLQLPAAEVLDSFRGIVLPDIAANRAYLGGPQPGITAVAREVSAILVRAGLLGRPDDLADLVSDEFLPENGT
jgi:NitT/TauT family transport system substrate-binding protein